MKKKRTMLGLLSAGLLAAGLGVGMTDTATAATTPKTVITPPGGDHEIISALLTVNGDGTGARDCLDVIDASKASGQPLQIFHCHGSAPNGAVQLFNFVPTATGVEIVNKNSHLCVTPDPSAGVTNFSRIQQRPCGPFGGQSWQFETFGSDLQIRNMQVPGANLCLGVSSVTITDHDPVVLRTCGISPEIIAWDI